MQILNKISNSDFYWQQQSSALCSVVLTCDSVSSLGVEEWVISCEKSIWLINDIQLTLNFGGNLSTENVGTFVWNKVIIINEALYILVTYIVLEKI